MRRSGFTLIEIVLVIGVLGVVTGLAAPVYRDYQIKSDLNLATEQVSQGIERARLLAQSGAEDSAWGFYAPAGVLYRGDSYATRNPAFDELYPMPSTIKINGLFEVNYSQVDGRPSETGSIHLTTINNEERTVVIEVNAQLVAVITPDLIAICVDGETRMVQESDLETYAASSFTFGACEGSTTSAAATSTSSAGVDVDEGENGSGSEAVTCDTGKMTICHVPPGNPVNRRTLCVAPQSWPAHRASGSTQGACAVEIDEPTPVASCSDRFFIDDDGGIVTTGGLTMTARVIGTLLTFGNGGPEVAVRLEVSDDGGAKWKKLFSGKNIAADDTDEVRNLSSGAQVALQVQGYYKESQWLRFDETYSSDDQSGRVVLMRNGSLFPSYPAFTQGGAPAFLQPYLAQDGTAALGPYDALLLAELGSLDNDGQVDFQDAVVLLQFSEPTCN